VFRDRIVARASALIAGDPRNEETFVGPMIDVGEAERLESWIGEAVAKGGRILCGGHRVGAMLEATLLENVASDTSLNIEEAFGPVAFLSKFHDFGEALRIVNDSRFGLQAGVFTRDLFKMLEAWDELDVGGVVINDVPSYRVDNMPYGGVKDSGLGREGIRFAMEHMTEIKNLVIRRHDPRSAIVSASRQPAMQAADRGKPEEPVASAPSREQKALEGGRDGCAAARAENL
jgi:acyl-CoA reductase-like NAD-dependent aldehyde dehydrogenase